MKRKTFYIIDGHAQIFRAFFAPFRDLSSRAGEPTKATFVFTQWLINLMQTRKPDYLAMTIDSGDEHVFRKQFFPEYKANRESPPDDFYPQEKRILQIVRAAGIPIFVERGFEADDLIATLSKKLCETDVDIYIVSKDKDLRQLIGPHTFMYDMQNDRVLDREKMIAEYGYAPEQAIAVQTLMGDAVDNVPGVPGVGEKTAAKLVTTYGSIDAILQNLDKLTPKLRENLEKSINNLPISQRLVTLKDDMELKLDIDACVSRSINTPAVRAHLEELGLTSLINRLGGAESVAPATPVKALRKQEQGDLFAALEQPEGEQHYPQLPPTETAEGADYRLVQTETQFAEFLAELKKQKRFAFDTETDALGAMASLAIGMSFSWKPKTGWYVPVRGPSGSEHLSEKFVLDALRPILEDSSIKKIGHNIKYDLLVMRQAGVRMVGIELDTMIAAFLLDSGRMQYGIDRLALDLLNFRKVPTSELIGKGRDQISMQKVDLKIVAAYASEDADIAWRLAEYLEAKLAELPQIRKLCDEIETPLIDVLAEMEANGISVDPSILKEQSTVLGGRIEDMRGQIFKSAGVEFNPDSPKQLQDVLFNRLGLTIIKRNKTGPSTDVEVLEKLSAKHDVPKLILEYRSMVKLKNTYLDNLTEFVNPRTGRIHASFNQIGAATGRLSCSDPNMQNIPIRTDEGRRIRSAFVPGDRKNNVLLTADYSQMELRVLAHFTAEPALLKAFENDEDIHKAVAAEVFGVPLDRVSRAQRDQAKVINFGIVYGVSANGLVRRIEGLDLAGAKNLIDSYNKRFPSIQKFLDQCVMEAQTHGFVETITGRRRAIPEIKSNILASRNAGERIAINSVVQGSAADLMKIAMNNIHRRILQEKRPSKMLIQVHDELVFETPRAAVEAEAAMVSEEMTGVMKLRTPLKVQIGFGNNWREVK